MKKREKWAVTVETYIRRFDPNYGKEFAICGNGVVHLEGEACDCDPSARPHTAASDESRHE